MFVQPITRFTRGGRGIDPEKPSSLSVDDALWMNFRDSVDPLVKGLNRGIMVVYTAACAIAIFFITTSVFLPSVIVTVATSLHTEYSIFFFILPVAVIVAGGQCLVVFMNIRVDKQITEAVLVMSPRFAAQGYSIEYCTLHTGMCKPKGVRPERIIAFPVASSALTPMSESASALAPESENDQEIGVAPGLSISDQMMADLKRKF